MAEVLFLGGEKVRSLNDIIGTPYIAELLIYFVEGKLTRWMSENKSSDSEVYLEQLNLINDKDFSIDMVDKIQKIFDTKESVGVIKNQLEFEKAMADTETMQFILLGEKYSLLKGTIADKKKVFVGLAAAKSTIDIGYALEKRFNELIELKNIQVDFNECSTVEDIIASIKSDNLTGEAALEKINSIDASQYTQELIRLKIDILLQIPDWSESEVRNAIEQLSDIGEKNFCLYLLGDKKGENKEELAERYLRPALHTENIDIIYEYANILKDKNKEKQKNALETLEKHASKSPKLLNLLGDFYLRGIGAKSNIEMAIEKYEEARKYLNSDDKEIKHSFSGIGLAYKAQGKIDDAMSYYSMSSDKKLVREVVEYYKEKKDIVQVESHYQKLKELGECDALFELSVYLFDQGGESWKEKSLDYAIEYARMLDANIKKREAILNKQISYYYDKEKHDKEKNACDRIEREAADNGLHVTRNRSKMLDSAKEVGKWAGGILATPAAGWLVKTAFDIIKSAINDGTNNPSNGGTKTSPSKGNTKTSSSKNNTKSSSLKGNIKNTSSKGNVKNVKR